MIYRILVSRDLPPEIAILTPRDTEIELAANGTQRIEIRALDPDFGLSSVVLQAHCRGKELVNENLLKSHADARAETSSRYDFSPSRWGLAPGDQRDLLGRGRGQSRVQGRRPESRIRPAPRPVHHDRRPQPAPRHPIRAPRPPNKATKRDVGTESGGQAEPSATVRQAAQRIRVTRPSHPSLRIKVTRDESEQPNPGEEGNQAKAAAERATSQQGDQGQQGANPRAGRSGQQGDQGQQGNQGQSQQISPAAV